MTIKWTKKSNGKTYDITKCVGAVTWSGSVEQAAREADITVLNAPNDPNIKELKLNLAVGDIIALYEDKQNIFYGEIQTGEKKAEIGTVTYKVRDLMDHLLRTKHKQNFKNKTPEAITKEICKRYGIATGEIASTKKAIKKMIIDGSSLYEIIMIAYTKAAKTTGKKYMAYMQGKKLCVKVKGTVVKGYTLDEYKNITAASYEETIENMVDQVKIYSDKGKQIGVVKNDAHIKRYGIYQEIYTKESGVNANAAAKNMLNGVEKNVNIEAISGNIKCVAGDGIKVYDAATGLTGLFWISNDTHTWEGGQHKMSLELSFKNVMDEKEADSTGGSSKKKAGSGSDKDVAGTYTVISNTTIMRTAAGRNNKAVKTLKKGTTVKCDGKYTYVSGTAWYYATAGSDSGYVYSKNLQKA